MSIKNVQQRKVREKMENISIPIVDLSPFFGEGNQEGKEKAIQTIRLACEDSGFFQIVNHGVPPSLMSRAIELLETFFNYPEEEKLKSQAIAGQSHIPVGYFLQRENLWAYNERLMMFVPNAESKVARFNVLPDHPPEFRGLMEELGEHLSKTALLLESILNDCMGLPLNFLREYNSDRSNDFIVARRYFPASSTISTGVHEHADPNCFTFIFQDEIEGLQVLRDGQWLAVTPTPGTIVVNIGELFQVITNNKFKAPLHRVVSNEKSSRYSYSYFVSVDGDKWLEPLPHFTEHIEKPAQYKGFSYREYTGLYRAKVGDPHHKPEDRINISYYAIPT